VFPDPVTEQADRLLSLWWTSNYLALAVAAVVVGLILFVTARFRAGRHDDGRPVSETTHNVPAEVLYTVAPLAVVAVLFGLTLATQGAVSTGATDGPPDLEVEVTGFTWQWQFRYPEQDVVVVGTYEDPPELVLPVGRTTRLHLLTTDVVHSFWVPEFLTKRDLIPGVRNDIDVHVREPGRWIGRCAEFCGLDHHRMRFAVRAVPPAEFDAWLEEQRH
jgi:cytochrome c oxidase subunit 2